MGKRFWSELEILEDTFDWAQRIEPLQTRRLVDTYCRKPLLAVGSGGSYTSAVLAAYLHRLNTGNVACPITPLELVHTPFDLSGSAVLFLTASGGNPDIVGGFRKTAPREPAQLGIFCLKKGSALSRAAKEFTGTDRFEFALPAGKDGFLATNSLVATAAILANAYSSTRQFSKLSISDVAYQSKPEPKYLDWLKRKSEKLWEKQTLVVLYGPSCQAAAVDLESKFTEAALGQIQLADYRNFAHGRHHWLARHGSDSSILAFVTDDVRQLAEKTLGLIPKKIPQLQIDLGPANAVSAVGGIINTLHLVGLKGKSQDFDPGRPHVPDFGRKIYHLKAFPKQRKKKSDSTPRFTAAVNRKLAVTNNGRSEVETACMHFVEQLESTRFGAIVCDYDGTLCSASERLTHPREEIVDIINNLLNAGVVVGIASGRGTSLRKVLQSQIEKRYWDRVLLGYYNGAEIASLASNESPHNEERAGRELSSIAKRIRGESGFFERVDVDVRDQQISVIPYSKAESEFCYQRINEMLAEKPRRGLKVFRSGHSIDVVAPSVSKRVLVREIETHFGESDLACLCVGDRGRWPGNDSELLMEPNSISVDELSSSLETCWNLASPGIRNVDAALEIFDSIELRKSCFVLRDMGVSK